MSVAITHWATVSPYGVGAKAFTTGVREGRTTAFEADQDLWRAPAGPVCLVPEFDVVELLGRKGTKGLDRATALTLVALGELPVEPDPCHTGVVFGTTNGSVHNMMDITRTSFTANKPTHIDTARLPSCIMNFAAGQCAIRSGFHGPNVTIAGGRVSALLGLGYGARLLASGRADVVLCATAEEYSGERAWLEHQVRGRTVLGEGAVIFRLEASATGAADLLGFRNGVWFGSLADVLRRAVLDLLARSDVRPAEVRALALAGFSGTGAEHDVLNGLFPGVPVAEHDGVVGDTGAVAAGFAVAGVLATAEPGALSLVTAVDPDGQFSIALFRVNGA